MKKMLFKTAAIVLSLVMMLTMLSACGSNTDPAIDEIVDAAVKAALEAAVVPTTVTIEADGRQITIEDTEGKSIQQLLEQADITLNDGDVLSVVPGQMLTGNITIQVLRRCAVTIVVAGEDSEVRHTAVLVGGTVADAIAAVGLEVTADQSANYDLTKALENGLEIIISAGSAQEPAETEPEETEPDNSDDYDYDYDYGSGSDTGSDSGSDTGSGTESERTVVSVVYYEDCDGSGHGVMVITYSDGTQEEVPY